MGLFDLFRKEKKAAVDFMDIDSNEKVMELAEKGVLVPLYLMPLRFHGEEAANNRLFVPPFAAELKDRYDDMVEDLLSQDRVDGYSCTPEYKGNSFVPSKIQVTAKKDGKPVFTEIINIW